MKVFLAAVLAVRPPPSDTTDESDRMSEVLSVSIGEPLIVLFL